jgi:hypothetical protein
MSFSVVLLKGSSPVYTFGSHTPFFAPVYDYVFDGFTPPRLVEVRRAFSIEGVIYTATEAEAKTKYDALLAVIEDADNYPDGLQLLQDTTPVVDIRSSTGHSYFQIEQLALEKSDHQWRGELRFTCKITAVKRNTRVIEGTSTSISGLTLRESWSYDEAGLLTQTLTGQITTFGASATAAAGAFGLDLPGPSFGYVTNGPKGCDVEQLDEGDTKASFASTIRQVGRPLPDGVGPSFKVSTETTITNGEKVVTTTVTAQGPGAVDAVAAQLPSGAELSRQESEPFGRTASAVYVKRQPASGDVILRSHQFTATGGDRSTKWTKRSGGRSPLRHKGLFEVVEVEESISVEIVGIPALPRFKYPPPVAALDEDRSRFKMTGPYVVQLGSTLAGHRWALDVRRVYFAKDFKSALAALSLASFSARASASLISTTPDKEAEDQKAGKD